jgi:hypothetical protein
LPTSQDPLPGLSSLMSDVKREEKAFMVGVPFRDVDHPFGRSDAEVDADMTTNKSVNVSNDFFMKYF